MLCAATSGVPALAAMSPGSAPLPESMPNGASGPVASAAAPASRGPPEPPELAPPELLEPIGDPLELGPLEPLDDPDAPPDVELPDDPDDRPEPEEEPLDVLDAPPDPGEVADPLEELPAEPSKSVTPKTVEAELEHPAATAAQRRAAQAGAAIRA